MPLPSLLLLLLLPPPPPLPDSSSLPLPLPLSESLSLSMYSLSSSSPLLLPPSSSLVTSAPAHDDSRLSIAATPVKRRSEGVTREVLVRFAIGALCKTGQSNRNKHLHGEP
jgi:hypothetical protein